MIPRPAQALMDLAIRLATNIAPNTTETFYAADSGLIAQLMFSFSQEFERAVDVRMTDIEALKALFSEAPSHHERNAFLKRQPASLRLADVNALHDEGTALLIELHTWAEQHDDRLNQKIWRYLREHSERHKFELP